MVQYLHFRILEFPLMPRKTTVDVSLCHACMSLCGDKVCVDKVFVEFVW